MTTPSVNRPLPSALRLSIEIEVNKIVRAENHACHEKQTESLPVPYSLESENLRHSDVPEKLKNQRRDENRYYDRESCETSENQRHASRRFDFG
jgi:hypothetical protein